MGPKKGETRLLAKVPGDLNEKLGKEMPLGRYKAAIALGLNLMYSGMFYN